MVKRHARPSQPSASRPGCTPGRSILGGLAYGGAQAFSVVLQLPLQQSLSAVQANVSRLLSVHSWARFGLATQLVMPTAWSQ